MSFDRVGLKIRMEAVKEQLRREMADTKQQQNRLVKEENQEITCIVTNEKQDASQQAWAQIRAEAESRQRSNRTG